MRDDRLRWDPPGTALGMTSMDGVRLTPVTGLRQTLVSGQGVLRSDDAGWPGVVTGARYRLALRRDRVLEVGGAPRVPGWDAAAQEAVSDASTLQAVFDLCGPSAFDLLTRGTEITLGEPSRSVLRRVFGMEVLLYRRGEDAFRLHVGAAWAEALVHMIRSADAQRTKG